VQKCSLLLLVSARFGSVARLHDNVNPPSSMILAIDVEEDFFFLSKDVSGV